MSRMNNYNCTVTDALKNTVDIQKNTGNVSNMVHEDHRSWGLSAYGASKDSILF